MCKQLYVWVFSLKHIALCQWHISHCTLHTARGTLTNAHKDCTVFDNNVLWTNFPSSFDAFKRPMNLYGASSKSSKLIVGLFFYSAHTVTLGTISLLFYEYLLQILWVGTWLIGLYGSNFPKRKFRFYDVEGKGRFT